MGDVVTALGPHVLWLLFLTVMVLLVGRADIRQLLARVSSVGISGVRIDLESAMASAGAERDMDVPLEARKQVAERLRRVTPLLAQSRFLWIDDNPVWNAEEMRILKTLGATIDLARSDEEARQHLSRSVYDIVLSDIRRDGKADAGIRFLEVAASAILSPKVIFYVSESKGKPLGAYGIATRPDKLMGLIADALLEGLKP